MSKLKLLWVIVLIPFIFACSEEDIQIDESNLSVEEQTSSKGVKILQRIGCDITGRLCGSPGGTTTLTYVPEEFEPDNITWSIQSGNVSIISGQGTNTVTLRFASNYTGGTVAAIGTAPGANICGESRPLTVCTPPCQAPTSMDIDQLQGGCANEVFWFRADRNGGSDSGSYTWSVGQGATILSGQGTQIVRVRAPSVVGFSISVNHVNICRNTSVSAFTLAEYDASCTGSGGGPGGLGGL